MKKCTDCKFSVLEDHGYSNYTVEGTTFSCGIDEHPDGEFDRFYGEEPKLEFAEKCSKFEAGDGIEMDVDHENERELSPEQKDILDGTYLKRLKGE